MAITFAMQGKNLLKKFSKMWIVVSLMYITTTQPKGLCRLLRASIMKKKLLTSDNAIKCYLWLEQLSLSALIVFICLLMHSALIPLVGMWIAIKLRTKFDTFYRFMYSFIFLLFMLQIYIYIKDHAMYSAMIGLPLTLFLMLSLRTEELKGRTLWSLLKYHLTTQKRNRLKL